MDENINQPVVRSAIYYRLSDVEMKEQDWLWQDFVPIGCITLLIGDPGTTKSQLTLNLAATVTRGRDWPDGAKGNGKPSNVLVLGNEDGIENAIRPRLVANDGDDTRVYNIRGVRESSAGVALAGKIKGAKPPVETEFDLATDLPVLREMLETIGKSV
jgi:hypothetical protein